MTLTSYLNILIPIGEISVTVFLLHVVFLKVEWRIYMSCIHLAHRKCSINEAAHRWHEHDRYMWQQGESQGVGVNKVRPEQMGLKILQRTLSYKILSFISKKLKNHWKYLNRIFFFLLFIKHLIGVYLIFKNALFRAVLGCKLNRFLMYPFPYTFIAPLFINILLQSGISLTTDEPILSHNHPKYLVL